MVDNKHLFESSRSTWDLKVTGPEMRRVENMFRAMNHGVPDPVVWVQAVGPATRRWWSDAFQLNTYMDSAGTDTDPSVPVAIPLSFLSAVNQLTGTYGSAVVFLNTAEKVLTAESGGEYVVVDQTVDVNTPPPFDPMFATDAAEEPRCERITVRTDVLHRMMQQYRVMFGSIEEFHGPSAFTAMKAGRDQIQWTTDWSRWDRPRLSGYSVASTWINHFEITFFPATLFNFLLGIPMDEEVGLAYLEHWFSPDDASHFIVFGSDWAAWCPVEDEGWMRWDSRIESALEEFGFERVMAELGAEDTDAAGHEIRAFRNDDVEIHVSIIDGVAGPDCIRFTYALEHKSALTLEVLEEVLTVSAALVNARLVIDQFKLNVIVDVDHPEKHEEMLKGVKSMLTAIGRISGLDSLLPLFGGIREKFSWETDDASDEDGEGH